MSLVITRQPKQKRQRRQTQQEKDNQTKKFRETMAKKKAKNLADESERKRREHENKKLNFFMRHKQKNTTFTRDDAIHDNVIDNEISQNLSVALSRTTSNVEEEDIIVVDNPPLPKELHLSDITNNLDYNEDDIEQKETDDNYYCDGNDNCHGVQQEYVKAIQKRLQVELSAVHDGPQWLLDELKRDDWWIRCHLAHYIVSKLNSGLQKHPRAFYRDVYVWLPDVQWYCPNKTFMPCCPNCNSNKDVGVHGFRTNHFGRVVITLFSTYYVMTRRYICYECQRVATDAKESITSFASDNGLEIEVRDSGRQYTFMGWDKRILPLFKYGKGAKFPAFLTWKAGVDLSLVHYMRSLLLKGIRPDALADILLENHAKRFTELCIEHENETSFRSRGIRICSSEMLGEFGDKFKYRGLVPTGRYLAHVYKTHHASIGAYMDKEVKKRGARFLHWDVSYKEAKHLCRYRGQPVFKGLVTAMNEIGEVRIQFHIYSDSHDQMKTALEAFRQTTANLGLPQVELFFTDNPAGDKQFYTHMLPSLQKQQAFLDNLVASSADHDSTFQRDICLPSYPYCQLTIRIASLMDDIENTIRALIEEASDLRIGLDAEWNVPVDSRGMRIGISKVQLIQIAYRTEKKIKVLLLKVGKLNRLPNRLQSLLGSNDSFHIYGANVSADLVKIAKDFHIDNMKNIDQKSRHNVHNLGVFARNRDVVIDGGASLEHIVKAVLNISLDKTLQCSDWSGELSQEQIKYAAIDAAVSLEVGEKLNDMPDLTRRLMPCDLVPGRKIDIIPKHGSVACMATRAASATIMDIDYCTCPIGIVYGKKGHKKMKAGKSSYVIVLDNIYSPGLIVPNYYTENDSTVVTVNDFPEGHHIVVPISMIKEHVECVGVRATPIDNRNVMYVGQSQPASDSDNTIAVINTASMVISEVVNKNENNDNDEESFSGTCEQYEDDNIDDVVPELSSREIDLLQISIFDKDNSLSRCALMESPNLSPPPNPKHIDDKYSAVLGDIFHAMDRAKIPMKHEAKKAYFVALSEAFLIWNPEKLKELTSHMMNEGMSEEEVKLRRYFNKSAFCDCVDRHCPAPSILYWRVRAVFVTYGPIIDSKSKQMLFNTRAWKRADNLLKEILDGYYSDPPNVNLYTSRLRADGSVMRNKYGMEMIECSRGTNRTEGYHKNITTTFGTWNAGIEMSDCLLREKRHKHNHNVAVARRLGYPKTGHSDTWLDEEYQRLVEKNHGMRIYPGLCNTSDYKQTNESFDTIPLQTKRLNDAVNTRFLELGKPNIPFTRDQQYLCKSMCTPLPLLPFSGEKEFKAYAKFVNESDYPNDDYNAAIEFCKYVDGYDILPKLPTHLRIHRDRWDRNQRVKECVEKAATKNKRLDELNRKIAPPPSTIRTNTDVRVGVTHPVLPTSTTASPMIQYSPWSHPILPVCMFPTPAPFAMTYSDCHMMTVAGISIGNSCSLRTDEGEKIARKVPGRPLGKKDINIRARRACTLCQKYEDKTTTMILSNMYTCKGRMGGKNGGRRACQYFTEDGQKKDTININMS